MVQKEKTGLNVSIKSFLGAIAVVAALMVLTYILTLCIPGGEFVRIPDANGNLILDPSASFRYVDGGLPLWKWLLSPILVLSADGGGTILAILAFLLVIGGIFTALDTCGLMGYMLDRITSRFSHTRYRLLAVITLFFMAMGAFIGSFEECIPLVPIVVSLAVSLGWDTLTGMGMSLLAIGCGFASGVCNPFTVGVAQSLAGLPMFSGIWLRLVSFVLIYGLLLVFLLHHAKKVDTGAVDSGGAFQSNAAMDRGLALFVSILGFGIVMVLCSSFLTFLQDYTMIIVALMFLIAGLAATAAAGMGGKALGAAFGKGVVSILPAVLLILMASSVKYTLTEGRILDTILHMGVEAAGQMPQWGLVLFIYLLVLVLNFFISSGSAKAFLLIPLIVPLAQMFSLSPQLCVIAFAFGDGFSNVFYPTNAALLIALSLANVRYSQWIRFSWKFQLLNLILTSGLLLFGLVAGY